MPAWLPGKPGASATGWQSAGTGRWGGAWRLEPLNNAGARQTRLSALELPVRWSRRHGDGVGVPMVNHRGETSLSGYAGESSIREPQIDAENHNLI